VVALHSNNNIRFPAMNLTPIYIDEQLQQQRNC